MKPRKHAFTPSVDGRLEDRLVLNGAGGSVAQQLGIPKNAVLTTRTYNNVLVNIHRAVEQFGRSAGNPNDYDRLASQVGAQLNRIPYANSGGLADGVLGAIGSYGPGDARQLYSDIRSSTMDFMNGLVSAGEAGIHKSPGHYFSDADLLGGQPYVSHEVVAAPRPRATPTPRAVAPQWNIPKNAILTTRTYNNVLVNIHRAAEQFGRSAGNPNDYGRLASQVNAQLGRLPYSRQNGLISYVNDALWNYGPHDVQPLYSDIRSTVISYLGEQVADGQVGIHKSPGNYFSDADILGLPYALT